MEQLEGCDDHTKAFVRAMIKNKVDGYMTRYFQQQMVGDLPTTATDAVTTSRTYTKLLEVCNKIKDVLESSDLDAEQMNERILELLSTINEDSEWKSPYYSDTPNDKSWMENTEDHLLYTFQSAWEMLCESPDSNQVYIMEAEYFKHMSDNFFKKYFTLPPISLFDKNPHNFSARLYRVKVGQVVIDDVAQDQYINMIVMDCSFFSPYAIQSNSSDTTRIKSSASLVAVTHVLVEAGIVSSEEGRFTHGTVSNPAGVVAQACRLILPNNYMVNQYEPGVEEVAKKFMRSSGDKHSLDSRKLHKLYAVAIVQILGVELVGNWLRNIHNVTVSLRDPNLFLQSMQQQGIENATVRRRLKRQDDSANLATLEQLVAAGRGLDDEQQVRLEELRKTKKRVNEMQRVRRQAKRQKREEDARDESHPMIELLLANSGGKKCSPKLIQLISNGTVKNVLTSYFVPQQKMKLSNKFLKTIDGCEKLSTHVLSFCFVGSMSDLMDMEHDISANQPLSREQSICAQQIIRQLFPE
jgi:hypothetical protein